MKRMSTKPPPARGELSAEVQAAARTIHREVWGESYRPLEGPMHYAGGPYWRDELRRLADKWERMAVAARVCADALPGAEVDARSVCEQCGESDVTTDEWGPWLCDACATATAQGDGGMTDAVEEPTR